MLEMAGIGEKIIKASPKSNSSVIIGDNIRFVRGEIIDISPKNSHENAHTENIAANVMEMDESMLIAILIKIGFFLILYFISDIISDTDMMPSVAKKDSHRPISNNE